MRDSPDDEKPSLLNTSGSRFLRKGKALTPYFPFTHSVLDSVCPFLSSFQQSLSFYGNTTLKTISGESPSAYGAAQANQPWNATIRNRQKKNREQKPDAITSYPIEEIK